MERCGHGEDEEPDLTPLLPGQVHAHHHDECEKRIADELCTTAKHSPRAQLRANDICCCEN